MRKVVPDVDLRLRLLGGARLRYLKQLFPSMIDVTDQVVPENELTMRLPTGSWADGTREYQVGLEVDSRGRPIDLDTAAARIELDVRGVAAEPVAPAMVLVNWTDEPLPPTSVPVEITRGARQQQLTDAVDDGCAAARRGDRQTSEERFGAAVQLAAEIGNHEILDALARVVGILEAAAGKVRLKSKIRPEDLKGLEVISTHSTHDGGKQVMPMASGPPVICPDCGWMNDPNPRLCEKCGYRFSTEQSL